MKRNLLYTALLCVLFAQSAWAGDYTDNYYPTTMSTPPTEGPWTFNGVNNGGYSLSEPYDNEKKFNVGSGALSTGLDRSAWNKQDDDEEDRITYQWQDADGTGFSMHCKSVYGTRYGVYSAYQHNEVVPEYTRKVLTWHYRLLGKTNRHPQRVALYSHIDLDELKDALLDFTSDGSKGSGSTYLIAQLVTPNPGKTVIRDSTELKTATFEFDNRTGSTPQTKSWGLMLTHVVSHPNTDGEHDIKIHQWGSFRDEDNGELSWTNYYYKYITFNANGGTGSMSKDTIENSGSLTANTFTREHYTFAGWATSANGAVAYADGAAITATLSSKGPVTLYAVWNQVDYNLSYELNGGTASNPTTYTIETPTFTLNNPTRDGYTFVGWTGSNGEELQTTVTITVGSYGDKSYTAHWERNALFIAKEKIAAIGEVELTAESKAKIDEARAAYGILTAEEKTLITAAELETLLAAEASYAALAKSTIEFKGKDGASDVSSKQEAIYYPEIPDGYHWQTEQNDNISEDKTIVIKAVYSE